MQVNIEGLEGFIEQRVREVVAETLGSKPDADPWLDSKAAASHAGVSLQRIHDLVCAGLLPRYGEKGERLFFRRSDIDSYMETRGRATLYSKPPVTDTKDSSYKDNAPAALAGSGAGHGG